MGIVNDILRFIQGVLLGMHDTSETFTVSLESAERYMRWGRERKDLRDFQTALTHLEKCLDEETPRPDQCLRKYSVLFEVRLAVMRLSMERLQAERDLQQASWTSQTEDLHSIQREAEAIEGRVRSLEKEGLLLKAREERSRLDEARRTLARMEEQTQSNGDKAREKMDTFYREATDEYLKQQNEINLAIAVFEQVQGIPTDARENVLLEVRKELKALDEELSAFLPGADVETDAVPEEPCA
ncbi:MAG: hypothetical protein V1918_06115 [Planctomycetota bacterium]